jgi:hypothetical protein
MPNFHAPYNFIPVTGKINGNNSAQTAYEDIKNGKDKFVRHDILLVPKLQLGNPVLEATASCNPTKLALGSLHSQSGDWERAKIYPNLAM